MKQNPLNSCFEILSREGNNGDWHKSAVSAGFFLKFFFSFPDGRICLKVPSLCWTQFAKHCSLDRPNGGENNKKPILHMSTYTLSGLLFPRWRFSLPESGSWVRCWDYAAMGPPGAPPGRDLASVPPELTASRQSFRMAMGNPSEFFVDVM